MIYFLLSLPFRFFFFIGRMLKRLFLFTKDNFFAIMAVLGIMCIFCSVILLPILCPAIPLIKIYLGLTSLFILSFIIIFSIALDRIAQTIGLSIQALVSLRDAVSTLIRNIQRETQEIKALEFTLRQANDTETAKLRKELLEELGKEKTDRPNSPLRGD